MPTTQPWLRAELIGAETALGPQLMIPADSVEFHEDQIVFHAQGEVVYVARQDQLRAITWYAKQPNPALARRRALWPNHGTRWTDDQRTDLRHRLQQGQNWRTISTAAGRSRTGCQQEAVKQGWIDAETLTPLPALLTDDAAATADAVPTPGSGTQPSPTTRRDPATAATHDLATEAAAAMATTATANAMRDPGTAPDPDTAAAVANPNIAIYWPGAATPAASTPHPEGPVSPNTNTAGRLRSGPTTDPHTDTRPESAADATSALSPETTANRRNALRTLTTAEASADLHPEPTATTNATADVHPGLTVSWQNARRPVAAADADTALNSKTAADPEDPPRSPTVVDATAGLHRGPTVVRQAAAHSMAPTGVTEIIAAQQTTPYPTEPTGTTESIAAQQAAANPIAAIDVTESTTAQQDTPFTTIPSVTTESPNAEGTADRRIAPHPAAATDVATTAAVLPPVPPDRAGTSVTAVSVSHSPAPAPAQMSSEADPSRSQPDPPTSPEPESIPPDPPRIPRQRTGSDPDSDISPGAGSRFLSRAQSSLARATLGAYMSPPKGKSSTPSSAT